MKYLILAVTLLCFSIFTPSLSQAKGNVKVGDAIPHNLELKDQAGKTRNFNDLKGEKGMTLVFVRSVNWCPYCQKQLIALDKDAKKFEDAGYPIVSVSYDTPQAMEKFITKNKPSITLLSDPRSDSIRSFGILNQETAKGTNSYGIPYPGVYIIDNKKKVQAKFFESDYKKRPSSEDLLSKIKELNPPPAAPYVSLDNMGQDPIDPQDAIIEIPEKIVDPAELDMPMIEPAPQSNIVIPTATEAMPIMPPAPIVAPTTPAPSISVDAPILIE